MINASSVIHPDYLLLRNAPSPSLGGYSHVLQTSCSHSCTLPALSDIPYDSRCTRSPLDHYSCGLDHHPRVGNILKTHRTVFASFPVVNPHPMSLSLVYWCVFPFPLSFPSPYSYPDRLVTHTYIYLTPCDILSSISDP